jgi:hypothetical protein
MGSKLGVCKLALRVCPPRPGLAKGTERFPEASARATPYGCLPAAAAVAAGACSTVAAADSSGHLRHARPQPSRGCGRLPLPARTPRRGREPLSAHRLERLAGGARRACRSEIATCPGTRQPLRVRVQGGGLGASPDATLCARGSDPSDPIMRRSLRTRRSAGRSQPLAAGSIDEPISRSGVRHPMASVTTGRQLLPGSGEVGIPGLCERCRQHRPSVGTCGGRSGCGAGAAAEQVPCSRRDCRPSRTDT